MNIKDIAATLAILGSGALMTGCGKEAPATEVPAGDEAAPPADGAEAKCSADHAGESHCEGDTAGGEDEAAAGGDAAGGEASCSAKGDGEASCSSK